MRRDCGRRVASGSALGRRAADAAWWVGLGGRRAAPRWRRARPPSGQWASEAQSLGQAAGVRWRSAGPTAGSCQRVRRVSPRGLRCTPRRGSYGPLARARARARGAVGGLGGPRWDSPLGDYRRCGRAAVGAARRIEGGPSGGGGLLWLSAHLHIASRCASGSPVGVSCRPMGITAACRCACRRAHCASVGSAPDGEGRAAGVLGGERWRAAGGPVARAGGGRRRSGRVCCGGHVACIAPWGRPLPLSASRVPSSRSSADTPLASPLVPGHSVAVRPPFKAEMVEARLPRVDAYLYFDIGH